MTTAATIIARAFRKIGVTSEDEAPTADMAASGLSALNEMIGDLVARGVSIPDAALDADDEIPLDRVFDEAQIMLLASRLAPEYGVQVAIDAERWFLRIRAAYMSIPTAEIPRSLRTTPSQLPRNRGY